jgi:hypothetical protein
MPDIPDHSAVVEAEGHLIDSQILSSIFDAVIERGAQFEVQRFQIGRNNDEFSRLRLKISAPALATLQRLLEELLPLGCRPIREDEQDAVLKVSDRDGTAPDDFYSTTNMRTDVRLNGRWVPVARQRMDAVIVVEPQPDGALASCRKLREVKAGQQVVCGLAGLRVVPQFRDRERSDFAFMSNEVSSWFAPASSMRCSPETPWPCTMPSTRCSAPRSASISRPAWRCRAVIVTTCARSTPSTAPAASTAPSSRAC